MSKATIATIAGIAGVSTATVDRVLHNRAGVRLANRQKVLAAARDVGYLPSDGMIILPAQPMQLAFLFPGRTEFIQEVSHSIVEFARGLPLVESVEINQLEGIGPEALERAIDGLPDRIDGVGVITTDHPRARDALNRLSDSGVRVVTIASDVLAERRSSFVGIDNRAAGRTAAHVLSLMTAGQTGRIALILGSEDFHGHRERRLGFQQYFAEHSPTQTVLPPLETGERKELARQTVGNLLRNTPDICGVYCVGAGRTGVVRAIAEAGREMTLRVVLHDLTPDARKWLLSGTVDAVIDQNAKHLGEQAVIRLLGAIAKPSTLLRAKDVETRIILKENLPS